jgi:hypothetical protein
MNTKGNTSCSYPTVLPVSPGALAALAHEQRGRVAVCDGATPHHRCQTLQESGERHSIDLEDVASRRGYVPPPQGSGVITGGLCRGTVYRRDAAEHEHAAEDCRLTIGEQAFSLPPEA